MKNITPAIKRLIILANHRKARFILSKGIKIHNQLLELENQDENTHEEVSMHDGYVKRPSTPSHFFDPDTPVKTVEKMHFAKKVEQEIVKNKNKYDEVILACEPKMLGVLKKLLTRHKFIKIDKTMPLDQMDITNPVLENKVFG